MCGLKVVWSEKNLNKTVRILKIGFMSLIGLWKYKIDVHSLSQSTKVHKPAFMDLESNLYTFTRAFTDFKNNSNHVSNA